MFSSKSVLFSLVVILIVFFAGCSEPTGPGRVNESNNIIPLKIGNSWNYQITSYTGINNNPYIYNVTNTVDRDTTINDSTWYSYNLLPAGIWYKNKADGYWTFIKKIGTVSNADTSFLVIKYPAVAGDTYGNNYSPNEVISTNEEITVPAGTFKVIHIKTDYQSFNNSLLNYIDTYIAPHIGMIKTVQYGKNSKGEAYVVEKRELQSYNIKFF